MLRQWWLTEATWFPSWLWTVVLTGVPELIRAPRLVTYKYQAFTELQFHSLSPISVSDQLSWWRKWISHKFCYLSVTCKIIVISFLYYSCPNTEKSLPCSFHICKLQPILSINIWASFLLHLFLILGFVPLFLFCAFLFNFKFLEKFSVVINF